MDRTKNQLRIAKLPTLGLLICINWHCSDLTTDKKKTRAHSESAQEQSKQDPSTNPVPSMENQGIPKEQVIATVDFNQNPTISAPPLPEIAKDTSDRVLLAALEKLPLAPSQAGSHKPTALKNAEEIALEKAFFMQFSQGNYSQIDGLKAQITTQLQNNPASVLLRSRLAYANLWQWQERYRGTVPSEAPKWVSACARLFKELFVDDPSNMVFRSFGTNCSMIVANLNQDQAERDKATALGLEAIHGLREYAPFALSYTYLLAPKESPRFQAGLAMLFGILDVCYGQSINRDNPVTYDKVVPELFSQSPYHYYCENTFMAPHNSEGFLMVLADALVKAGKPVAAKIMYENIKSSSGYETFPYRLTVDQRIANIELNSKNFNEPMLALEKPTHTLLSSAGASSCTLCHLASNQDLNIITANWDSHMMAKGTLSGALMRLYK